MFSNIEYIRCHPWSVAFLVVFVIWVDMVVYSAVVPILPHIVINGLGLANTHTGILMGSFAAGLLVFTPVFGYWSDVAGDRRAPMFVSLTGLVLSSALFIFCTEFWHFAVVRFIQGIAAAGNWTIGLALINDIFPPQQLGKAMGVVLLGMNLGYLVGPAVGGPLFDHFGHSSPFLFAIGISALAILLRAFVIESVAVEFKKQCLTLPHSSSADVSILTLLKKFPIWVNCIGVIICTIVQTGMEPILPPYLTETFNASVSTNGLIFLAISIPGIIMSPIAGFLYDNYNGRYIMIMGLILTGIATPIIAFMPTFTTLIVSLVVFGFVLPIALASPLPEMGVFIDRVYPHAAARIYSILTVAVSIALLTGPILAGGLYDFAGLSPCLITFGVMCVLCCGLYWWYDCELDREASKKLDDIIKNKEVSTIDLTSTLKTVPCSTFGEFYLFYHLGSDGKKDGSASV